MGPVTGAGKMNLFEIVLLHKLAAILGHVGAFNAAFGAGDIRGA